MKIIFLCFRRIHFRLSHLSFTIRHIRWLKMWNFLDFTIWKIMDSADSAAGKLLLCRKINVFGAPFHVFIPSVPPHPGLWSYTNIWNSRPKVHFVEITDEKDWVQIYVTFRITKNRAVVCLFAVSPHLACLVRFFLLLLHNMYFAYCLGRSNRLRLAGWQYKSRNAG